MVERITKTVKRPGHIVHEEDHHVHGHGHVERTHRHHESSNVAPHHPVAHEQGGLKKLANGGTFSSFFTYQFRTVGRSSGGLGSGRQCPSLRSRCERPTSGGITSPTGTTSSSANRRRLSLTTSSRTLRILNLIRCRVMPLRNPALLAQPRRHRRRVRPTTIIPAPRFPCTLASSTDPRPFLDR